MKKHDFYYKLPEELIASYPLPNRSDSRLLVANATEQTILDSAFSQLTDYLNPGDLLVFNDSRVIPARLFAQKPTGGKVEILIERSLENHQALVHLGSNKALKAGQILILQDKSEAKILGRQGRLFILQFAEDETLFKRLEKIGHIPLPHYMKRKDETSDLTRYQTVYARQEGSVAAPTAGLHFDESTFIKLKQKNIDIAYVTLHVGSGTFLPVQTENILEHTMHHEWMHISQETCEKIVETKRRGNKVIAVGTTSLRCLESAALNGKLQEQIQDTNIFIYPGFNFKIVDGVITNFHLPESTLLMLVSALIGLEFMHKIYQHAIEHRYRFYSYGDASLLLR